MSSTKAPAGSSGRPRPPSVPSVSAASAAMPGAPSRWIASARAYSWLGPPWPLAAQRHRQFAAGQDRRRGGPARAARGRAGVLGGDLAGLALQAVAEHDAVVAGRWRARLRAAAQRVGRPRDDAVAVVGKDWHRPASAIHWRDRRARGSPASGRSSRYLRGDRARIGERGRVGHRRAGADHRRIVARHVGDRQRDELAPDRRAAPAGRP